VTILFCHDSSQPAVIQEKQRYNGLQMPRKLIVISSDTNRPREIFELCNHHVALNKEVSLLRRKYDINESEMRQSDDVSRRKFLNTFTNVDLQKDVRRALKKLKINEENFWYIYQYVIDGKIGNMSEIEKDPDGLIIEYNQKNKDQIIFKIGPKTTGSDIDIAWEMVKQWRYGGKSPRKNEKPKQGRDYEIFVLHRHGMTLKQICLYIDEMYGKNNEDGMSETSVRKILKLFYRKFSMDLPELK
jgi:hypothetical protein